MSNLAAVLKSEVARIARKEARLLTEPLKKQLAASRTEVSALKRRLVELEKLSKSLQAAKSADAKVPRPAGDATDSSTRFRFRAGGLASNRKRLGLTADQFGRLVGATGQSVYSWEAGKSVPRGKSLAAIASLRGVGKKEVAKRLEQLDAK